MNDYEILSITDEAHHKRVDVKFIVKCVTNAGRIVEDYNEEGYDGDSIISYLEKKYILPDTIEYDESNRKDWGYGENKTSLEPTGYDLYLRELERHVAITGETKKSYFLPKSYTLADIMNHIWNDEIKGTR